MKKKLLIAGDSFSADWSKKYNDYPGWVNTLQGYDVTNISQAGASEYKIHCQLSNIDAKQFDKIIVCHTSPYRIYTKKHPVYSKDSLHNNCDLIYNDLLGYPEDKLVNIAVGFFEHFFDEDHAEFVHNLIIDKIITDLPTAVHISFFETARTDIVPLYNVFKKQRGLINHLTKKGNELVLQEVLKLLDNPR